MPRQPKPSAEERLRIDYVPVATVAQWERNAKKHDFGALWESIDRFGFKDPPKFEPRLNTGSGGIVEGNGRSHVLREMEAANHPRPRGILIIEDKWHMPVLFGVDAESERAAEAYGITHNNLTLMGGDFGPLEIQRLWEETEYAAVLADLAAHEELPVGIDGEDVDALIGQLAAEGNPIDVSNSPSSPPREKADAPKFGVLVICEGEPDQAQQYQRLRDEGYDCIKQGSKPPGCKR
ncbi:hypothetical protein EON83_12525 [bacterium]|nr:MAG: hypothetical protein EON83_12525 [bacterium]